MHVCIVFIPYSVSPLLEHALPDGGELGLDLILDVWYTQ